MSDKVKHSGMRYCWAIKVPESPSIKGGPKLFGRMLTAEENIMYPIGIYSWFATEAEARAFLRNKVVPHRGRQDCRVVRVRIEEKIEEVDRFPDEAHMRWSIDGQHFAPRRKKT